MATFKAYANGSTMGIGNAAPVGGIRGEVIGWSQASVRRHKKWLYSIEAPWLTGVGDAVTLTMRDTPASSEEWQGLLQRLFRALRDHGMVRWHWVVEWQRRGTPHLHLAVYAPPGEPAPGQWVMRQWVLLAAEFGALPRGQFTTEITGPVGWLKYLSKHASRGVAHYQRQGKPTGWTKTGRLWGYGGEWPSGLPVEGYLTTQQLWRVRRMVRDWAIADARARGDWRSVGYLRRLLKNSDRALSSVRGISEWVPGPVFVQMALCAGWSGELVEESDTVEALPAPPPSASTFADRVAARRR